MDTLQAIFFGQRHVDFDYKDYKVIQHVKRLANKHQTQAVNGCNGYGVVKGQMYYGGSIDNYARREYGQSVKSSYIDKDCEENIFDKEGSAIQDKINLLIKDTRFTVEYQGDPRGNTVKLFYEGDYIVY